MQTARGRRAAAREHPVDPMRRALAVTRLVAICLVPIAMALVPMRALNAAPPVCLYTIATGTHCWGCGMTRALCSAVRGEFLAAFDYNARVIVVLPVLFFVWLRTVSRELAELTREKEEAPLTGASG